MRLFFFYAAVFEIAITLKFIEFGFFWIIPCITFAASFNKLLGEDGPCDIGPDFLPSSSKSCPKRSTFCLAETIGAPQKLLCGPRALLFKHDKQSYKHACGYDE